MMRFNFQQSLDFVGSIVANGTPKITLDGGPTYDELIIETNLAVDEFDLVVEVNNDKRVKISGQELKDRLAYDGRVNTAGFYIFSFSDGVAKSLVGEGVTAMTTKAGDRITVSLEIGASIAAGTPAATLHTETSPNRPEEYRLYCLPEQIPVTKIGKNKFAGFRSGLEPDSVYMRRFFAYGPITHFSFEQDRRGIFGKGEMAKAANDARLASYGKVVPTSSTCFVFDPVVKGNVVTDWLDTFNREALRATFTTSAATSFDALTEYVERIAS